MQALRQVYDHGREKFEKIRFMEILNYKENLAGDKVFATFDVATGSRIVYPNMRLRKGKNGGFFVARPCYLKSDDGMGNKVYGNYPEMPDEMWKDFSRQAFDLIKPFLPDGQPF